MLPKSSEDNSRHPTERIGLTEKIGVHADSSAETAEKAKRAIYPLPTIEEERCTFSNVNSAKKKPRGATAVTTALNRE